MNRRFDSNPLRGQGRSRLRKLLVVAAAIALVSAGAVASVTPAQASSGVLYGRITAAGTGVGLGHVLVDVNNMTTPGDFTSTFTNSNGYYSLAAVPSDGNYRIQARGSEIPGDFVSLYYPTTPFYDEAAAVPISAGSSVEVNIALPTGGGISGNISLSGVQHTISVFVSGFDPVAGTWASVGADVTDSAGNYEVGRFLPGWYRVTFSDATSPALYANESYDDARYWQDSELVEITVGATTHHIDAELTVDGPSSVIRLAGQNRFQTAARISHEYDTANVVFVANGLGYPDALSAAPAAAYMDAPLLLVQKDSIPAVVRAQIERLEPYTIFVVGGPGVISDAVLTQLGNLASDSAVRLWGTNRYGTSQAVFTRIWEGKSAPWVFLADGRNFPDALSSASAAAWNKGPVVLVNGGDLTLPTGFGDALHSSNTHNVALAGGTAVLSSGIENAVNALSGITAHRYYGANRYKTSVVINTQFFGKRSTALLAVGTGFADALSGAALAGAQFSPLYLTPGSCVPQDVLDNIIDPPTAHVTVLGGTGVISPAVQSLTSCTPSS